MEEKHEINFKTKVKNLRYLIIDNSTIIIIGNLRLQNFIT